MKNKGSVTIFCCLMITAMVLLGLSALRAVSHHLAKAKGAVAVRSAMSGVNAGYNSYIFENYHILLFDKYCGGRGEAYLEEQLIRDIQYNLGDGFQVCQVGVSDYELLLENDCQAFKEQIKEYCGYALIESGANSILESTGGQDGTVSEYVYQDIEAAEENEEIIPDIPGGDVEDPRDFTENLTEDGILAIVAPEDLTISSEIVELYGVPSLENKKFKLLNYEIDNDFDDMDVLREDIGKYDSWKDSLISGGAGVAYASAVFNCATKQLQEDTVFNFELEYIICGMDSDKSNLKGTVNRIIGIRLPVNYAYLVSDAAKMGEIAKLSVPLSMATMVPEPILRYLIAGCWAYVEAIFDVRCLLEGQSMDFLKNSTNWKTDLYDLESSVNLEGQESESGLCYKDYLLILLSMNMEDNYYRMLDVIELNTKKQYPNFDMNNASVGFSADVHISYDGKDYYYSKTVGY
ncbi:MAG: hypothetical protein IKJ73_07505 [Lachnospiraceae bacterium]|nr:hypothetical protein [Lachnospiraceae bacterium]